MSKVYDAFMEVLNSYDNSHDKPLDQFEVISELKKRIPGDQYEMTIEEKAEVIAFSLVDQSKNSIVTNGSYFGPQMAWVDQEGKSFEWPSRSLITPEMISYWEQRSKVAKHPFLVARYTGLVWDLSEVITGVASGHENRKRYISFLLEIIKGHLYKEPMSAVFLLNRSIEIAGAFNDKEYYEEIKSITLSLAAEYSSGEKPGLWAFPYDILTTNSKKIKPSSEEINQVIKVLEKNFEKVIIPDKDGKTDPVVSRSLK
jgi:hypothetical protein